MLLDEVRLETVAIYKFFSADFTDRFLGIVMSC